MPMSDLSVTELLRGRRPNYSLEQPLYSRADVLDLELDRIFRRCWLFVGHGCEIPNPGDYMLFEVGPDSNILCRGNDGGIRGFHNTCRHRGSRIAVESRGTVKRFVCPYHNWAYDLDGALVSALYMGDAFDKSCHELHAVQVENLEDFLFISLADAPPSFDRAHALVGPHLRPYRPEKTKVCHRDSYLVHANWKLIIENNRECYHCRVAHPEFMKANYDLGMNEDPRAEGEYCVSLGEQEALWRERGLPTHAVNFPDNSWFRCARMPLKKGFVTETLSGAPSAPLLGDLRDAHCGSLRVVWLPNAWMHANCDYIMSTSIAPVDAQHTRVTVRFLVHEDAQEGVDYRVEDVAAVWKATSEQDWRLCENNQLGINSSRYTPGPYSMVAENAVERYVEWYLGRMLAGANAVTDALGQVHESTPWVGDGPCGRS